MLAHVLAALLLAAPGPGAGPRAPPRPPAPARLSDLRLDAWDAALTGRFGRLFAVAGRILEQAPLDGDAYRMAGDAALLGGRPGEARRLLAKAQLIAPLDATERLLQALAVPLGPPRSPADDPPAPPAARLRALAWLDLAENRHLSVPRFTCTAAARALEAQPDEAQALAIRRRLACPEESDAGAPPVRSEPLAR